MENQNQTRNKGTKKDYLLRSITFIERAYREAKEQKHDIVNNPKNIYEHEFGTGNKVLGLTLLNTVIWACKYWSKEITQESWRSYRSALIFTSEMYLQTDAINEDTFNRIKKTLSNTKGLNRKEVELRTSAKKQKHISLKDLRKIDTEISKSKSKWATALRLWLRAGVLTGLRPIEWKNAKIIKDENGMVLIVKNAKNTNDRANGETRTLHLNHLTKDEITVIDGQMKVVSQFNSNEEEWKSFYQACSDLLRQKNKKAFPNRKKHPTLYSARHQFSANAKASGCRPEEIAALMGHATDLTAQMTYGKKINGTRGKKPKLEEGEVNTVKIHQKTTKYFNFKKELEKKVGNKNPSKASGNKSSKK